jgi:hypothetical protein
MLTMMSCQKDVEAQNLDAKLKITVGDKEFTATLYDNETAQTFISLLPMTINISEMGGYEKYYYLPQNLPGKAENVGTTYEGDLMIWSSNCLVLFCTTRSTSYNYMKLGRIDNTNGLREALGSGNVEIKFEVQNSTTGINNVKENQDELIFPNPVSDYLHVSGEFEQLSLISLNGTIISQSKEKSIYTGNLASGIYLLRIDFGKNRILTKKIIK